MDVWQTCFFVPGFTRSECASWVQAWGSVLAILAAIGIAAWQRHQDHVREDWRARDAAWQQITVVAELLEVAVELTQKTPQPTSDQDTVAGFIAGDFDRAHLMAVHRAADRFMFSDAPDGHVLPLMLQLQTDLAEYASVVDTVRGFIGQKNLRPGVWEPYVGTARDCAERIRTARDRMYIIRKRYE